MQEPIGDRNGSRGVRALEGPASAFLRLRDEAARFATPGRGLPVALVVLAALAAWVWWSRGVEVKVAVARIGSAAEVVYATGVVEPNQWAKVSALQRKQIVYICHCEGRSVAKGDVLARLDDSEARAQLVEIEARLVRLREDAERLKILVDRNATTRTNYDDKLTQVREYEARVAAQKERIADLELKAPMDGVVLRRDGEVGEIAGTGNNDVLFWVGRPRPLRVVAEVNEEDISKVQGGQVVLLRHEGYSGPPLKATVESQTPKGDPQTKTFRVYIALPDDTPLQIGMSVEANIVVLESDGALLVPAEAVTNGSVQRIETGKVRRTPVEVGIRGTRRVAILKGLPEGATVASPFRAELKDGTRVRAAPVAEP